MANRGPPEATILGLWDAGACTAGTVTADPTYNQVAGVGFNTIVDTVVI